MSTQGNRCYTPHNMKSVGIIGGVGPETSAQFYLEVVFGCQKRDTTHRPLIVMSSVPISYELENDEIINQNLGKPSQDYLVTEAKRLEKSGVDFLVLPCNSLHVFIKQIRESINIPALSILEEVVKHIKKNGFGRVGLITTSATVKYKIYENIFLENGIDFVVPTATEMTEMDKIISRLTNGVHLDSDRETLLSVIAGLKKQGVDAVALACTDLQLLIPDNDDKTVFDTMRVLANATVDAIVK